MSSLAAVAPVFQESARCDVCNCSFNTFRRRHHCRSCGRTLCHDHSSNHMALPQYGIYSPVRICDDCFNNPSRSGQNVSHPSANATGNVTDKFSRLNVGEDTVRKNNGSSGEQVLSVPDCKCGMPLCICEAPIPDPVPTKTITMPAVQPNPRPKKVVGAQQTSDSMSKKPASSTGKQRPFFNLATFGSLDEGPADYDASGEGLRGAIKNGDANAVRKLLSEGVDANYCDKQGSSLLHLAALFNQTEIAIILMDHGASTEGKNAQGETPIDCAPTVLQHKMRKKLEDETIAVPANYL